MPVKDNSKGNGLEDNDEDEQAAGNIGQETVDHHGDSADLADQVDDDKEGCEEVTTAPEDHDVLPLLDELRPHPDPVLQEGGHQEDPGQVGQHWFGSLRRQLRRVLKGREKGHGEEQRLDVATVCGQIHVE